jgi:hypothetical protein
MNIHERLEEFLSKPKAEIQDILSMAIRPFRDLINRMRPKEPLREIYEPLSRLVVSFIAHGPDAKVRRHQSASTDPPQKPINKEVDKKPKLSTWERRLAKGIAAELASQQTEDEARLRKAVHDELTKWYNEHRQPPITSIAWMVLQMVANLLFNLYIAANLGLVAILATIAVNIIIIFMAYRWKKRKDQQQKQQLKQRIGRRQR